MSSKTGLIVDLYSTRSRERLPPLEIAYVMIEFCNEFHPGQVVRHKRFDYRGVIVGVDQTFQLEDEWYDKVARSRPPKDKPWYHVLVHGTPQMTYVAERHLECDTSGEEVEHPLLGRFFDRFREGFYSNSREEN